MRNATSNIVTTQINTANIVATKLTSTNFADVGDVITYATILTNNGNIPASNVTFTDIIPAGTIFLPNTVTINGVPIANANPANGILIGTIGANSSRTVVFQVLYQLFLVQINYKSIKHYIPIHIRSIQTNRHADGCLQHCTDNY